MKRTTLLALLLLLPLTACNGNNTVPPVVDDGEDSGETGGGGSTDDGGGSQGDDTQGVITKTVSFASGEFTGSFENANKDNFVKWFNSKCDGKDLLKDVVIDGKVQINKNVKEGKESCTLWIGSSEHEGNITFSFNYDVSKIVFDAQAYYKKYYDYSIQGENVSLDTNSKLFVNNEETPIDLACEAGTIPVAQTITREYETPIKSFSLASIDAANSRVMIDYMTITFKA